MHSKTDIFEASKQLRNLASIVQFKRVRSSNYHFYTLFPTFQLLAELGIQIIGIAITQKFDGEGLEKITKPRNIIEIPTYRTNTIN